MWSLLVTTSATRDWRTNGQKSDVAARVVLTQNACVCWDGAKTAILECLMARPVSGSRLKGNI